jgi:methyl-accepting chemotaxis protein
MLSELGQRVAKMDLRRVGVSLPGKHNRVSRASDKSWRQRFASLSVRAAVFTVLTCTIPILIIGWYSINQTMNALTQAAVDRNDKVAERIASDIGYYILNKKNFVMAISSKAEIRSMDPAVTKQYLQQVQPFYGGNDALFVADAQGKQISRSDNLPAVNVGDREYFQQAMQGKVNFSDPVNSKITNQLNIMGAVPIYSTDSKVIGVLGANLAVNNLQNMIEQSLSENPGFLVTVIDKNRVPLYHQVNATAVVERSQLNEDFYQAALEKKNGDIVGLWRGQEYFISYRPVANTDWVVVSFYPKDTALQATSDIVAQSITVAIVLMLVFVVGGLLVTRKALAPLSEIETGVKQVSGGDLTQVLAYNHPDELGNVAKSFNSMIESLGQIVQSVKQSSAKVLTAAASVAAAAGQSSNASQQVAASLQQIAAQVAQQSKDTAETGKILGELMTISSGVSESAGHVALASHACAAEASQGQVVIDKTVNEMRQMKTSMEKAAQTVAALGHRTKEVDQISVIISAITKQINLLSLNAAIEAARAGEAGRGFAVVADEVRKLAEQSADAVNNITTITKGVQAGTVEAVAAMEEGFARIEQGVETAGTLGVSFTRIVSSIAKVQEQADNITAQTERQVTLCRHALDAVTNISALAEENTDGIQGIAAISEEQSATIQNITGSVEELKNLAHTLEEMVHQFKV